MNKEPYIPSPCNKRCSLDGVNHCCRECLRTIEEVKNWKRYTNEQKLEVLEKIKERKQT